jgi:hypothetical protein
MSPIECYPCLRSIQPPSRWIESPVPLRPSQRVEGNTLYPRTGLSEAGYTKHPISCVPNGRRLPAIRPPKIISIFPIPRSL